MDTGKKQKRKETQTAEPKLKDPPTTASDISSDSLLCVKRKRKPPGAWWLSSPDESTAEPQPKQVLGTAQGLKASTKTQARQAAAVDSEETQSLRPAQGKQKKPKTNNVLDEGKKLIAAGDGHDTGAEQKTAKNIGGRRKPKSAVIKVPSQAHVSGEEVGACLSESAVEISPEFNSPNKWHKNLLGKLIPKQLLLCMIEVFVLTFFSRYIKQVRRECLTRFTQETLDLQRNHLPPLLEDQRLLHQTIFHRKDKEKLLPIGGRLSSLRNPPIYFNHLTVLLHKRPNHQTLLFVVRLIRRKVQ